jgi:DNA-directed RNA polymerase subunit K/omega
MPRSAKLPHPIKNITEQNSNKKSTQKKDIKKDIKNDIKKSTQKKDIKKDIKKSTQKKDIKKDDEKNIDPKINKAKTNTDILFDDEPDDIIDDDVEIDTFFENDMFSNLDINIKYNALNPDSYVHETHKEIIVVSDQDRITSEVITKYEYTEVTSNRAQQIENGSQIFVDINDEDDPIKIAELEVRLKRCPLSIRRFISSNICEIWAVNDMIIPY